ncbi:MAG: hypothetical protein MK324_16325, partial [Pirellulales bacterium]|nr:hypothetical protein [Pirellulales bacterium]
MRYRLLPLILSLITAFFTSLPTYAFDLRAGASKIDITHPNKKLVEIPLLSRALVLQSDQTTLVIVTMDVVSIGEIGSIPDDFQENVRKRIVGSLGIPARNIMFNASPCHGIPSPHSEDLTVKVIEQSNGKLEPATVKSSRAHEDRIQENRRMKLKDGSEIDVRHAYSLPANKEILATGLIDPEGGILRVDKLNGESLAVLFNFACHPIQGTPVSSGDTSDMTGYAAQVIEDNLDPGTIALFIQGCGGDINPLAYKDLAHPRHAEVYGNMLGLSTLKGIRKAKPNNDQRLIVINETLSLPRSNLAPRIMELEQYREAVVNGFGGTTLNLRQFIHLTNKHNLSPDAPSYHISRYLHDELLGHKELRIMDANNKAAMNAYLSNIYRMEELTRVNANLRLLKMHQQQNVDAGKRTVDVEVMALRLGNFVMVTFPGELTVPIGLGIKERSPHPNTFVAGYTNGYIYYCPTADQLKNVGGAQEDSDCILDPQWQEIFEAKVT